MQPKDKLSSSSFPKLTLFDYVTQTCQPVLCFSEENIDLDNTNELNE
jgi:hypothetical protein